VNFEDWLDRLRLAHTEAEVLAVARAYLASFDEYELRFLPPRCRPRELVCSNDVSTYAFDLVVHRCEEMDASARLVRTLAAFYTRASIRVTEIVCGTEQRVA
jgi:hypothetical protein